MRQQRNSVSVTAFWRLHRKRKGGEEEEGERGAGAHDDEDDRGGGCDENEADGTRRDAANSGK